MMQLETGHEILYTQIKINITNRYKNGTMNAVERSVLSWKSVLKNSNSAKDEND